MKKLLVAFLALLFVCAAAFADEVRCIKGFDDTSCTAGSYVESGNIRLNKSRTSTSAIWRVNSNGILSLQPDVSSGTFTFTVYFSNFEDASVWDSGTTLATGIDSSNHDRINIDPQGVALWMKIRATETGGSGSPVLSASLCTN